MPDTDTIDRPQITVNLEPLFEVMDANPGAACIVTYHDAEGGERVLVALAPETYEALTGRRN
jgi:hypothetical protein